MANKASLFAGLHILMRAIPDGPADTGHRLYRYWYRERRCQVRTGWQKTEGKGILLLDFELFIGGYSLLRNLRNLRLNFLHAFVFFVHFCG